MMKTNLAACPCALFVALAALVAVAPAQQQTAPAQTQGAHATQTPAAPSDIEDWGGKFDGDKLDDTKWELYSIEGGGGKIEIKEKQLRMHGAGTSRAGVRSKREFRGDRFYVEAAVAKVGDQLPQPGGPPHQPGHAILTLLFGGPNNRIEWILRSDGIFEAWSIVDGRSERLDNNKLATKEKSPRLGIGRKGDQFYFMLNGQVGLERTIRGLPSDFKVMLYAYGSSQANWDSVSVQTRKL